MLPALRDVIRGAPGTAARYGLSREAAEYWNLAWRLPNDADDAVDYVFYGADVRSEAVAYLRDQMERIAQIRHETIAGSPTYPDGVFFLDEDGTMDLPPRLWELRRGRLHERERPEEPPV